MALGQFELAARVLAGLFVIVTPTLLFLGLWHGLQSMRDDALVQRVRERVEASDESPLPFAVSPTAESSTVLCPSCGAGNREGVAYCRQCLSRL